MKHPHWLEALLGDRSVTDILINGGGSVFAERNGALSRIELTPTESFTASSLQAWAIALLSEAGKSWDARFPFVDLKMREGHRAHLVFPPVHDEILLSIRASPEHRGANEIDFGNSGALALLRSAVARQETIVISGSTGSGKTTLLNHLLGAISPDERIIALEEVAELNPKHRHFIRLLARAPNADGFGEISLRTLLRQTLRMRPDRLLLGECRGGEVLDLLQALNTGHRGSLVTLHANSCRDALRRIELLTLLHGPQSLSSRVARELIAASVQWIVQLKRVGAKRMIHEILRVEGIEGDAIIGRPMLGLGSGNFHGSDSTSTLTRTGFDGAPTSGVSRSVGS